MPQGENRRRPHKIRDWQVCREVLGMDHNMPRLGPQRHSLHQFCGEQSTPMVVEPAPPSDAVHVREYFALRQIGELFPRKPHLLLHHAEYAKIPRPGIKARHRARMQDWPLERERLSWGQPSRSTHLMLPVAALV